MSALTDLFTAMANKIRSKTGTQTTYTPAEMVSDGIDDVFDAGVASVPTPTSITPSDSSPVALTANVAVKPSASGYAIESNPTAITPSTVGAAVASGDMIRIGGSGYVVNPQSKTPSDTSPVAIIGDQIVKATATGYFVKNSHPALGKTPDKTYQNATAGSSGTVTISVTQKPRYIVIGHWGRTTNYYGFLGIVDVVQNKAYRMGQRSAGAYAEDWSSSYASYFTTISATQVIYDLSAFGANSRVQIQIFY